MCTIAAQTPPATHGEGLSLNGLNAIHAPSSATRAAGSIVGMALGFGENDLEIVSGFHEYSQPSQFGEQASAGVERRRVELTASE